MDIYCKGPLPDAGQKNWNISKNMYLRCGVCATVNKKLNIFMETLIFFFWNWSENWFTTPYSDGLSHGMGENIARPTGEAKKNINYLRVQEKVKSIKQTVNSQILFSNLFHFG